MIQITRGTFGYFDGKRVVPIKANDPPVDLKNPEMERKLVEQFKVAKYVREKTEPDREEEEKESLPYNRDMKYTELKAIAEDLGIDTSGMRSKNDILAALEEIPDEETPPELGAESPV